ncbi:uncharacterized protein LOC108915576 [Anoplophora glabripennis]|uniref:uncharacterized protein LOC108915576 n=1 Tax=Anoplophora glabripennis TaxID=217634 RepID=UPI000873DF9D|nr:uncharacterized protein LOC108915576 [Anoplophora glabripennis]
MCTKTDTPYTVDYVVKLSKSFYVDNCITRVPDETSLRQFIQEGTMIMKQGKFEFRGWKHSRKEHKKEAFAPVLGLKWCLTRDTLMVNDTLLTGDLNLEGIVVTKRIITGGHVSIHLLAAKARVAPFHKLTIPRLELLAATIGARLYIKTVKNFSGEIESYFWSDSSTVVAWIQRKEEWATLCGVWNRVAEIRALTHPKLWRHIPGSKKPADLPSRGCSPKYLLESKWWEGPEWLYESQDSWPTDELACDELEINLEKKRKLTTLLCSAADEWHLDYFSGYTRTIRMVAWIYRFCYNLKHPEERRRGELTTDEMDKGETYVIKMIQAQSFSGEDEKRLSGLNPFCDKHGILRLKTRISRREDLENFRFPMILPSKHPVVEKLILEMHKEKSHAGPRILLSLLRESYWILGGRRTIKSTLSQCVVCKRYNSKHFVVEPPPLPKDRVRDEVAFEMTEVDMAGPLYLQTGEKAWVCMFTCAVYSAVHFELCTSMSSPCFMKAFRRFVARRGRPKVIYSECGTNFVGTENALSQLDWETIFRETSTQRIKWKFNPPTAARWGNFWERLSGIMKQMLQKVLGRSSFNYEDLMTILCYCESVINSRPLTYISNDLKDLVPITPSMFLRDLVDSDLPDCDIIHQNSLNRKLRYRQKISLDLRHRFRSQYLGQLKLKFNKRPSRPITFGEVVLVANDIDKRLHWPLGRIIEIIPGTDGKIRLVRVKTERGQLLRPIQRIYPLECLVVTTAEEDSSLQDHPDTEVEDVPHYQQEEESCDHESAGMCKEQSTRKNFAKWSSDSYAKKIPVTPPIL